LTAAVVQLLICCFG